MEEIFKDILNYEGLYQVSNLGNVRSLNYRNTGKPHILKQIDNGRGYLFVQLWKNGRNKKIKVHRLVAEAFIINPENKPEIDHINGCRTDNRAVNLVFCTHQENCNNPITIERNRQSHLRCAS